ncbi:MAG: insecticidal toxin complex protein, partial [Thermoanaerobaculia bacterium]|nr:insecticidal toxin complex protein [Thermoanaerobaculia bacterium]
YLKRALYGNTTAFYPYDQQNTSPYNPPAPGNDVSWHFELVLDYGEHDAQNPTTEAAPNTSWPLRPDPFSAYRSGFEIRTCRLLKRALMFHRFNELNAGMPTLVRSLDFNHFISDSGQSDRETELEFLESIAQTGYVWLAGENRYSRKSLPPMAFTYQPLAWNREISEVRQEELVHSPVGLSGNYQWVDLYNEGINGILTEQAGGWFYKHNLGDVDVDAAGQVSSDGQVRFEAAKLVLNKPSLSGLASGALQLQDLEANGEKQLVVTGDGLEGYFELNDADEWQPFRAFLQTANIDLKDPNVRTFDIDGDGQPEIVITEENAFCWFPSKGKLGYDAPELAPKPFDEEQGPAIVFSDQTQSIFLADMSGDGLIDIARIRNGEVCYWANLGHGRFSRKVTMANAPLFDRPEQFNPAYIQLADISGTGATDLIYLGQNRFKAWLNLSGNRWGEAEVIEPFFPTEQPNRVTVTDLLGNGTGCIVWSSEMPGYGNAPMRYIDLMGGKKPHIMTKYVNNFGKETTVEYKSSTWFYLLDKLEGKPWVTKLPFPVQVVCKSAVEEKISKTRFTAEYRYHHGYYDHPEREFRGFGMVEQTDTELHDTWQQNNAGTLLEKSETLFQPPVLTKTWFHTGAFLSRERILTQFEDEYWYREYNRRFPDLAVAEPELPDATIVAGLHVADPRVLENMRAEEWREALRACKGMTLRQEVFALDAPKEGATEQEVQRQWKPYSVATHTCHIQLLQPGKKNAYAVFMPSESAAIAIQYERNETDPRIAHTLNVKIDELGNVLEAASVVYPRKQADLSLPLETRNAQAKTLITFTRNAYTNDVVAPAAYRLRRIAEAETFEITDLPKAGALY